LIVSGDAVATGNLFRQASVEKRLKHGLQGRFSFTWNKIMQETGYFNDQDDWSMLAHVQAGEPTKVATLSLSYSLPIFASSKGFAHNVLGGWEVHSILRYVNGSLVGAPGGVYSTGVNPKLDNRTYQQWFNTCTLNTSGVRQNCADASQPVAFIQTPPYTLRTLSGVLPGIRTEVPTTMDLSLFNPARFGKDALRFVSTPEGRALRLRGMNARITKSGTVRVGDPISIRS